MYLRRPVLRPRPHRAHCSAAYVKKGYYLHSAAAAALCVNTLLGKFSFVALPHADVSLRDALYHVSCVDGWVSNAPVVSRIRHIPSW